MKTECPNCGSKENYSKGISATLLYYCPFYDKDGNYHNHDGNRRTESLKCKECGKYWERPAKKPDCPTCGSEENWKGN